MIAIQSYTFHAKKIPFSEGPKIVKEFLKQQSLHYRHFFYFFTHSDTPTMQKVVKEIPNIGPIRGQKFDLYLSNIEDGVGCTEDEIMANMAKIYRRYGFWNSCLVYQDIDYFSYHAPSIRSVPCYSPSHIHGSRIDVSRDRLSSGCYISLDIVIYDGERHLDPKPYRDAIKKLLPRIRCQEALQWHMTDEEKATYERLKQTVKPHLESAKAFLKQYFPKRTRTAPTILQVSPREYYAPSNLSFAPALKKLGKQYGYTYGSSSSDASFNLYSVHKRTPMGHYIQVEIDAGSMKKELSIWLQFWGVGFRYDLGACAEDPIDQEALERFMKEAFDVIARAEEEVLPALDAHFPQGPDWY